MEPREGGASGAGLTGSWRPRCSGPRRPEPGRLARGVGEWRDTCGRWSVSETLTVSSGDSGGTPAWELPGLRVAPAVKCASAYPKADARRRAVGLPPSPASDAPSPSLSSLGALLKPGVGAGPASSAPRAPSPTGAGLSLRLPARGLPGHRPRPWWPGRKPCRNSSLLHSVPLAV